MSLTLKTFALALVLTPAFALAAPAKKASAPAAAPVAANDDTIAGSMSARGTSIPAAIHNHLSVSAKYDFADQIDVSGGNKLDAERSIVLGAQYEFDQFSPGLAAQVGGTYDINREVKNTNGLKVQEWTAYGELAAKVTPVFKVMGGLNYNFPNLTGAAPGASIKGKIGYQIGASYLAAPQIALEASYRQLEMEVSGPNGAGGTTSTGIKVAGFMLGGRYGF
jgi:opacity protein-like surface antigen